MSKNAIVTGSSSGIGLEISNQLRKIGYNIIGIDLSDNNSIDVRNLNELKDFVSSLKLNSLELLINSAGIFDMTDFADLQADTISKIIDTNLKGTINVTNAFLPLLLKSNNASVVNIASGLAIATDPNAILYCVTKAAIVQLTKGLALRYAKDGLRFNNVLPGPIMTPMLSNAFETETELNEYKKLNPMNKIGTTLDVWHAVEYLISDKAGYVTGASLSVCGGETITSAYS